MTFSVVESHVSTSERTCSVRQASCESLLPKLSVNLANNVQVEVCGPIYGTELNSSGTNGHTAAGLPREHSALEFVRRGSQEIMTKEPSIHLCQPTDWTDNSHNDLQPNFCDHTFTTSQSTPPPPSSVTLRTQPLENHESSPHVLQSTLRSSGRSAIHSTARPADGELDTISILGPRVSVISQPCTPVLNEYPEPDHSVLCCVCVHCQKHCFSSKSTPSRCSDCAARLLSISCASSSCCDWHWNRWRRRRIPNENLLVLSVIQLLCGFAAIILSSVALTKAVFLYQMATGMWAGFLMLITGTQGLIASRRPIVCTLTGLLTLCVVVTIAACLLICVSVAGTIEDGFLDHMNTRSRTQHQTIKLTYSFHPSSPGGLQKSDQFYSLTYQGMSDNRTVHRLSWGAVRQLYSDRTNSHFVGSSQDTHLRTCQVILHVLLLLVGILESSVSLSTCVLCCRCVCARSGRFGTNQNPFATRTNIVSLNAATANQAASVLRSGELNQFIGSGNLLLAVSAGTPSDPSVNLLRQTSSGMEPCVHPSVAPFLPQFNRPALILTQAGTGAMAWTAARAAATLVDRESVSMNDTVQTTSSSVDMPALESSTVNNPSRPSRFRRIFHPQFGRRDQNRTNRLDRPQLLFTSLNTINNRNSVANQSGRGVQNSSAMVTGLPSCPPGSTLLYVMPSPNSDSPPMIFPPFPPVYSSLQKRPSVFSTPRRSGHGDRRSAHTHRNPTSMSIARSRGSRSSEHARSDRSITRQYLSRIFTWHRGSIRRGQRTTGTRHRRSSPSRSSNSTLICAGGNRLLQPVLIIEDPDIFQMNSTDPPPYSAIDHSSQSHGA